jgi:hypothetical protein
MLIFPEMEALFPLEMELFFLEMKVFSTSGWRYLPIEMDAFLSEKEGLFPPYLLFKNTLQATYSII